MAELWNSGQFGFFRGLFARRAAAGSPAAQSTNNGWTGGQFSLFRVLFGTYLFVHFAYLAFWASDVFSNAGMIPDASLSPLIAAFPNPLRWFDSPTVVTCLSITAAFAAIGFTIGKWDKPAALLMWLVLAWFLGRNPLISNPAMPYVGWMLLAYQFVPSAPYGSWAARGRNDPGNGWQMPSGVFLGAWLVLALSYSYSGYTKLLSPSWVEGQNVAYVLTNPLARDWMLRDIFLAVPPILVSSLTWFILVIELFFAPLALMRKLRPWVWGAMLFVQFGFAFLLNFPDLTIAMLLFHLFTFNPDWVKGQSLQGTTVHYDGNCGLCHGAIRFLLAEDRRGELRFAPLQGGALESRIGAGAMAALGDTMVVDSADGVVRTEASAVIHLLLGLGGIWKLLGIALRILPLGFTNAGYRFVGARRIRWFGSKDETCPILPAQLRERFSFEAAPPRT
jgi:predicted DCC family thiol-disulfide oxidoreductase YuxK